MADITGGCQCGAVRYEAEGLGRASICHCRMCQKAFGGFFGPLVTAHGLRWVRGEPSRFASSSAARRGFCKRCGTPLTYEFEGFEPEISIGSLDDPERAPPAVQVNPSDRLSYFASLHSLPERSDEEASAARTLYDRFVDNQHPDHPTEDRAG